VTDQDLSGSVGQTESQRTTSNRRASQWASASPRLRLRRLSPLGTQQLGEQLAEVGVILDHEDAQAVEGTSRRFHGWVTMTRVSSVSACPRY
jgi:hypothetical protein